MAHLSRPGMTSSALHVRTEKVTRHAPAGVRAAWRSPWAAQAQLLAQAPPELLLDLQPPLRAELHAALRRLARLSSTSGTCGRGSSSATATATAQAQAAAAAAHPPGVWCAAVLP